MAVFIYTCSSFTFQPQYLDVLSAVRRNLEASVDSTTDPYNLAIMAYALQLSNNPSVDRILSKLDTTALLDSGKLQLLR